MRDLERDFGDFTPLMSTAVQHRSDFCIDLHTLVWMLLCVDPASTHMYLSLTLEG